MCRTDNIGHDKIQNAAQSVNEWRLPTMSYVLDMVVFEIQNQSQEEREVWILLPGSLY